MAICKREATGRCWDTLWRVYCLGIGMGSLFFLISCGSEEKSASTQSSGAFTSSKPVGSTALSHGGPARPVNQKGGGVEDSRIGQRIMVRSRVDNKEQAYIPLLSVPPGVSGSRLPHTGEHEQTLLPGSLVTVVGVMSDPSSGRGKPSSLPVNKTRLYMKVERDDGVQGWVPGNYLAYQNPLIGEK